MAPKHCVCKILIPFLIYRSFAFSIDFNYPAIFNFGDSNSDTGGYVAGLAYHLYPPNGQTYFSAEAMDLPFLNPYLDAIGEPSFAQGCNFAVCGSSILTAIATSPSPYALGPQVAQFFRFRARVLELKATTKGLDKYLPVSDYFEKGLYMFDIGQNDVTMALFRSSFDQNLYEQGARNFWIHNTGPLGCLPAAIKQFGTDPLDEVGCVIKQNHAAKYFNLQLQDLYQDAKITYVDIFAIKYNLMVDYTTLG
ncbi:hypothetical protein RJ639_016732 [Escallonia herrerae]|uniref:Esterase n=1 Tax=Escallonia herrerae TaxID=1293975 RepID=A0AA88VC02_9ASTE|nr:hypothetical protein RJ639_016732 [Escallonia herrerae]